MPYYETLGGLVTVKVMAVHATPKTARLRIQGTRDTCDWVTPAGDVRVKVSREFPGFTVGEELDVAPNHVVELCGRRGGHQYVRSIDLSLFPRI